MQDMVRIVFAVFCWIGQLPKKKQRYTKKRCFTTIQKSILLNPSA